MSNDCRHKLSLLAFEWFAEPVDVWCAVKRRASVSSLMAPDHSALGTFMIYISYVIFP